MTTDSLREAQPSDWERKGRIIAKIGTRSARTFRQPVVTKSEDPEKYSELGSIFFDHFFRLLITTSGHDLYPNRSQSEQAKIDVLITGISKFEEGINHGFKVVGRYIGHGVAAYIQNTKKREKQSSVEELGAILKNPLSIKFCLLALANLRGVDNTKFEEALSLFGDSYTLEHAVGQRSPFVLQTDEAGDTFLRPDEIRVIQTIGVSGLVRAREYALQNPENTCPAQRFLPILVPTLVEVCANNPTYFAQDLGLIHPLEVQ